MSIVDPNHRGSHEHLDDGGDLRELGDESADPRSPSMLADIRHSLRMVTDPSKLWRDYCGTGRGGQVVTLQAIGAQARATLCDVTFPEPRSFTVQVQYQGGTFGFLNTGFPVLPLAGNTIPFMLLLTYGVGAGRVQTFFPMRASGLTIPVHARSVRADIIATAAWTGSGLPPAMFSAMVADNEPSDSIVCTDVDLSTGSALALIPDFAEHVSVDTGAIGAGSSLAFGWVDSQATQFANRLLTSVPATSGTNALTYPYRWPVPNRAIFVALTAIGPGGPPLVELAFHVRG